MDLLDYYLNTPPHNDFYITRKVSLPTEYSYNLYGVRGSGKSTMVIDFLEEHNDINTLYIDCEDPHLYFQTIKKETLQQFLIMHHIERLVIDHYRFELFEILPSVRQLIVISRTPLCLKQLTGIELFPLDYEEFLAFENHTIANKGFNHFLRSGTLPLLAKSQKNIPIQMKYFLQHKFNDAEQKLLLILAQHHTNHVTIHQLYTFAKERFKVSKDWLYKTIKNFQEEKLIFFIADVHQKAGKKLILFDFAFAKYLSLGKPFFVQFDTMIALAFMKHHIEIQTLGKYGYITKDKELIIPAPFESEESLWVKSQNHFSLFKKYHIQKVTIITVANHFQYTIEKVQFEALPFDEWSVINQEEG